MPKMTGTEKAKTIDRSAYHYSEPPSQRGRTGLNGRGECTGVGFTCHHRVAGFECNSSTPELCPYFKNTGIVTDEREGTSTGFKHNSVHEMFEDLAKHDEAFRPIPCKPRKLTKKQREHNRKIDAWVRKTLKAYELIRESFKDSTLVFDA